MVKARGAILGALFLAMGTGTPGFGQSRPASTDLVGLVSDELGMPLGGATVSVFGKNLARGALTAVTDQEGRFRLSEIPPGMYRMRAYLSGFLPSPFARVVVEEGMERVASVLMSLSRLDSAEYAADGPEERAGRSFAELRWILQRGERNVLKDGEERAIAVADLHSWEEAPGFDPEFALAGEFGVRAATYDEGLDEFPGAGAGLDARLAYARLFIPSGDAHWLVSAQVLESALSSWAGRAEYVTADLGGHRLATGVSYGNFLYGDLEGFRPPEAALARSLSGSARSAEWFGSIYASDSFLVGSASVETGIAFQYFDYLDKPAYAAPRFAVSYPLGSGEKTVLKGSIDYRVLAPGGEDLGLLSRVATRDVYGPFPAPRPLRAETTTRLDLGLEQQITSRSRMTVRVFQEEARDQLVKAFQPETPGREVGHFLVANQGDFQTRGVGLAFLQSLGPVEGAFGYTFGLATALDPRQPGGILVSDMEIHDIMTMLSTSIDRTQTRLSAAYRILRHPGFTPGRIGFTGGSELDRRFSVQVFQLLPFVGWNGTRWELMVAVRDLFYDDVESASILDELAVIDAPRRVLGGVTVRF